MAAAESVFTRETFRFFRDLGRNNKKVWMDAHRDRYQATVVQPFRRLLEEPARRPPVRHGSPHRGRSAAG